MGKILVRFTIIIVTLYFLACYIAAQVFCIDILDYSYTLLFELVTVVYCYSEGKYHCKYIKHVALGIFSSDLLTRVDNYVDFMSVEAHNYIPIFMIVACVMISFIKALNHFRRVNKIKKNGNTKNISY